ncbi:hypothetical protein ACIBF5_19685 [Micromonospora sp. NPDC050417]|uniref:hypothetical protein n=1 Tax=Micromonospora sp. NPDC050417 TaxID=3364280 RepID=UPI00379EDD9B
MQPDSPYQLIEALGSSEVGTVWSAVDQAGTPLTVVVLDARAATDPRWREAFATAVNALAARQTGGTRLLFADFATSAPWAAFAADDGPGAERVFLALGVEYHPVPPDLHDGASPPIEAMEGGQPQPATAATDPTDSSPPAEQPVSGGSPIPGPPTAPAGSSAAADTTEPTHVLPRIDPWAAPPQVFSTPAQPVSPVQPYSVPPQQPVSVPPLSSTEPQWSVSGPPLPTSGQPYPVSGAPHSSPPTPSPAGPLPPAGPYSYGPAYSHGATYPDGPGVAPTATAPAGRRNRRLIAIVGVIVVVAAGAVVGLRVWPDGSPPQSQAPTSAPPSTPVPTSRPVRPGIEPPRPGNWPTSWPQFDQTSRVQTLTLDGIGFALTVPSTWDCVMDGNAQGFVRYNCGTTHADGGTIGGELIVRDCPKPCDEARRTTMRQAEDAWGQQWRYAGEYATLAETLTLDGEQRYGLTVVGYRRSVPSGTVDRQLVLRMTAPTDWVDEVRRVANGVRQAAAF